MKLAGYKCVFLFCKVVCIFLIGSTGAHAHAKVRVRMRVIGIAVGGRVPAILFTLESHIYTVFFSQARCSEYLSGCHASRR